MADECPTPSSLRRFAEATALDVRDLGLAVHVERCGRCRDDLSRLLREGPADGPPNLAADAPAEEGCGPPPIPGLADFREIGRGGAGVVYRARREGLDAWVAVKFLGTGRPGSRLPGERAIREARAGARVRHPHVVRTFEVGLAGGSPYIVMEYFEAGTLADRLGKGGVVAPEVAARLVVPLAEAAKAIHREGLIHRDLKPSNVLLHGRPGDPLEACRPIVGDFGLAREIGDEPTSDSLHAPGTPGYMAPEQLEARPEDVGPAADVFALGAILFRLVAGRSPFAGRNVVETLRLTVEADAPAVGTLAPGTPRALEAVIAKCLHRRPEARYASAAALAEDLRNFLEGRPVAARRACRRGVRRPSFLVATIAAATLVATIAGDRSRDLGAQRPTPSRSESARDTGGDATAEAEIRGQTEAAATMALAFGHTAGDVAPHLVVEAANQARKILEASRPLTERGSAAPRLNLAHATLTYGLSLMERRLGNFDQVVPLSEEASRSVDEILESSPEDPFTRLMTSNFLLHRAQVLRHTRKYDESLRAFARHIENLRPIVEFPGAVERIACSRIEAAQVLGEADRHEDARRAFGEARAEIQEALRRSPEVWGLWRYLGLAYQGEGRYAEAVGAQRRCLALVPGSSLDARLLASSLIETARWIEDSEAWSGILDEVDALARDYGVMLSSGRAFPGLQRHQVEAEQAAWSVLQVVIQKERERDARFGFAERLDAAIAAEASGEAPPDDDGWLASARETILLEYPTLRPFGDPSGPRFLRSFGAAEHLERGVGRLTRGRRAEGRIALAHGLAFAAATRRLDGDLPRAVRLCAMARAVLEAVERSTSPSMAEERLSSLAWTWTQTAKTCWEVGDLADASEALEAAVDVASTLLALRPADHGKSLEVDAALARVSRFACDQGDFRRAEEALERRRALWEPGSVEALRLAEDFRKLAEAKKEHEARDAHASAR